MFGMPHEVHEIKATVEEFRIALSTVTVELAAIRALMEQLVAMQEQHLLAGTPERRWPLRLPEAL